MADHAFLDLYRLRQTGRRALLATVVKGEGPTYRPPGGSAVVAEDGEVIGAISGGCLEADVLEAARRVFAGGPTCLLEYDTGGYDDMLFGTGSGCGGRVQVLVSTVPDDLLAQIGQRLNAGQSVGLRTVIGFGADLGERSLSNDASGPAPYWYSEGYSVLHQVLAPPLTLLLCGAGDDAQPVARLAAAAGFRVVVVDHRPALSTRERFPEADEIVVCDPAELTEQVEIRSGSYAVLLTHLYERDLQHTAVLLGQSVAYIGLLGARERSRRLVGEVLAAHPEFKERVSTVLRAPVGLDIGADGPQELALAIVAEMVAHRAGRSGAPLVAARGSVVE